MISCPALLLTLCFACIHSTLAQPRRMQPTDTLDHIFTRPLTAFKWSQPKRSHGESTLSSSKSAKWLDSDMWLWCVMAWQLRNGSSSTFLEVALKPHAPLPYLINLGAHYGLNGLDDIVSYVMQSNDSHGFAADADDKMPWAGKRVSKFTGWLTPDNIVNLLHEANVPRHPRLLKVDIDSYDVDVALAVLQHYSPVFIQVEINEKVPPPMCYCNRFPIGMSRGKRIKWDRLGGDAYGCSLMSFVNAFLSKGYRLVSVILNDAIFVRADQSEYVALELPKGLPEVNDAFRDGYVNYPQRAALFPWNNKRAKWIGESLPLAERAKMVRAYMRENGDGESRGMTYPFITHGSLGAWPSVDANSTEQAEWNRKWPLLPPTVEHHHATSDVQKPAVHRSSSTPAIRRSFTPRNSKPQQPPAQSESLLSHVWKGISG